MRVAIVGAGYTAREHARAFGDVGDVVVSGIFSRTKSRAAQLAAELGIPHVCDSVDDLAARTEAELVVVGVPEMAMNAVAKQCFQHRWSVMLEKPPGYDLADSKDIAAAAERSGSTVYVGLNRRFLSATTAVLEEVGSGSESRFIVVQDQQSLDQARGIGAPEEVVERWMFANSIHTVDYLRIFGRGEITDVDPLVPWDRRSPGQVVAKIGYSSGDSGLYIAIWDGPGPWGVSVSVPGTRWEMRPLEHATRQRSGGPVTDLPVHPWDERFKPGFRAQARAVVDAVVGDGSATTLRDALETVRLIDHIYADRSPASLR